MSIQLIVAGLIGVFLLFYLIYSIVRPDSYRGASMSTTNWIQLLLYLGILFALAPFLGKFMARVFEGERHILSFLSPVERGIYRINGIDATREMNWKQYLAALLIFNAFGFISLMALLMTQKWLPLNPGRSTTCPGTLP